MIVLDDFLLSYLESKFEVLLKNPDAAGLDTGTFPPTIRPFGLLFELEGSLGRPFDSPAIADF